MTLSQIMAIRRLCNTVLEFRTRLLVIQMYALVSMVTACVNSPLTSLMDHEIHHPGLYHISRLDYLNASLAAYSREPSCARGPINSDTTLNMRTLCPWEYVVDSDVDRFPTSLTVAKCKCGTCFENYRCKPVFYTIQVLKKQCTDGVIRWVRRTELISVACTCVRPTVHGLGKRLSKLFRLPTKRKPTRNHHYRAELNNVDLFDLEDINPNISFL